MIASICAIRLKNSLHFIVYFISSYFLLFNKFINLCKVIYDTNFHILKQEMNVLNINFHHFPQ